MKTRITTIIFDLSEVYLTGLYKTEHHLAKLWNIEQKEIYEKNKESGLFEFFNGKISEDEFWRRVIKNNNWPISLKEIKELVRKNFNEIEGTREIIERLKKKGYKLGLLSVHSKEWVEHCERKFDYHKLFHSISYSFEVAVCKPDKEAYNHILKKLKAKPEECLFIDDQLKNIKAARDLGISAILFKNPEQLKKDLKKLGIK